MCPLLNENVNEDTQERPQAQSTLRKMKVEMYIMAMKSKHMQMSTIENNVMSAS